MSKEPPGTAPSVSVPISEGGGGGRVAVANIAQAWNFGKRLGLESKEGDVEVEGHLKALEERGGGGPVGTFRGVLVGMCCCMMCSVTYEDRILYHKRVGRRG